MYVCAHIFFIILISILDARLPHGLNINLNIKMKEANIIIIIRFYNHQPTLDGPRVKKLIGKFA